MKIAFYIDNQRYEGIDYSTPEKGNPGTGGTQFIFLTTAYYLQKKYDSIKVIIYAPHIETMPSSLVAYKCGNASESVRFAKQCGVDILVIRSNVYDPELYKIIDNQQQQVVC